MMNQKEFTDAVKKAKMVFVYARVSLGEGTYVQVKKPALAHLSRAYWSNAEFDAELDEAGDLYIN